MNIFQNTWTQTDNSLKTNITAYWYPSYINNNTLVFYGTIVMNQHTFWTGQRSEELNLIEIEKVSHLEKKISKLNFLTKTNNCQSWMNRIATAPKMTTANMTITMAQQQHRTMKKTRRQDHQRVYHGTPHRQLALMPNINFGWHSSLPVLPTLSFGKHSSDKEKIFFPKKIKKFQLF